MGPALLLPPGLAWVLGCAGSTSVLLAASWLAARLLRRGAAAVRHEIWALGIVGALVMPVLCWALPALPLAPLLPGWAAPAWEVPPWRALASSIAMSRADPALVTAGAASGGAGTLAAGPVAFGIVWAMGTLLVSLRFVRGHIAAYRLGRAAAPAQAASWLTAHRAAAAALGVAGRTRLARSADVGSPMTIGVLRPQVLLPADADGWTYERLRAVLLHELGHVRRHDTRIQLAAQVVCAFHWWNPLAWSAAAHLRIEREHACDDLVLAAGVRPSGYAAALLDVARRLTADPRAGAGAICMVDPSGTEARLRRILDGTTQRRPPGARFRLATRGATVALAGALACAAAEPAPPAAAPAIASVGTPPPGAGTNGAGVIGGMSPGVVSLGLPSATEPVAGDEFRPPPAIAADTLNVSIVTREVQRHLGDLQQCYDQRLRLNPALSGEVVVHWMIAPSGEVVEQCVSGDTLGDPEVVACVNALVKTSRYPVSSAPFEVSIPFVFRAAR